VLKKLTHTYIEKSHHWRNIGHNQLVDLYMSVGIRTAAVSMVGVFLPIYFYDLGYSIQSIVAYYLVFAIVRIPANYVTAQVIGRIGPKHTIAISTVMNIIYMSLLFSLPTVGWPLFFVASMYTVTNSLFFTAYHTDFSKVKKVKHAGKELSHMAIIQRIGTIVGPIVGGLLANFVDPRASIAVAAGLLLASLVPLFKTSEPVKTHQKVSYRGLKAKMLPKSRNILAIAATNNANVVGGVLWTFFIAITVFQENSYASIGILTTATMVLGLLTTKVMGEVADKGHARKMLNAGLFVEAGLGVSRFFIASPAPVIAHNILREQCVPARGIPIVKGFYDEADQFPGQRIAYIVTSENIVVLFRAVVLTAVLVAMNYFDPTEVLRYGAGSVAILGLIAIFNKYRAI